MSYEAIFQKWNNIVSHHALHLMRNTGHGNVNLFIFLEQHSGCCTPLVLNHCAGSRYFGLFQIPFYDWTLKDFCKNIFHILQCFFVNDQCAVEIFTQNGLGYVIRCRSESARNQNNSASADSSSSAFRISSLPSPMATRRFTQKPALFSSWAIQALFVSITWPINNSSPIVMIDILVI